MGPSFAETATSRRFAWLIGTLFAGAFAMVAMLPASPPATVAPKHEQFKHYKRVGKCIDGRWVYANAPVAQ